MASSPPTSLAASHYFSRANGDAPLFQPPKSPDSVTRTPSFSSANDYFPGSSRKRQRPDSQDDYNAAQVDWSETPAWAQRPTPSDGLYSSVYGRSSGLVNDRYKLAGGFDTPSLRADSRLEHLTVNEHEFRRRLRDDDMGDTLRVEHPPISGPLARERNGIGRVSASSEPYTQQTWTSLAFGLVGKVFSFGSSVVRGFYSGGGKGYDLQNYPLVGSDLLQERQGIQRVSTPLPGAWQEDFLGDFEQDSPDFQQHSPISRPPNKRRQTDRDSWVMVGTPDSEITAVGPKRKSSSGNVPRSSLAVRPPASRASSRRSIAPMTRRGTSYIGANGSPAQQPLPTSPQPLSHSRRASVAATRSPQGRLSSSGNNAPCMSPEAERHIKRQAKQDKAINSMSRRMEDMIRQAQEALGTKYSVEGDADMENEDEGFVDVEY